MNSVSVKAFPVVVSSDCLLAYILREYEQVYSNKLLFLLIILAGKVRIISRKVGDPHVSSHPHYKYTGIEPKGSLRTSVIDP